LYRGGTSKALFIHQKDLPRTSSRKQLNDWIETIYGSGHPREINGIGGAGEITQSKFAIIGPPTHPDADVDYSFVQIIPMPRMVSWALNCGNIISAVGPFAIDEGLVQPIEPVTHVRVHNTNTGRILHADVEVKHGRARVLGDCHIDGVPGTGSRINVDWRETGGAITGSFLPTGNVRDVLDVEGIGRVEVSIVDLANLFCYVRAKDVGIAATEDPRVTQGNQTVIDRFERIRAAAAVKAGLAQTLASVLPVQPFVVAIAPPTDFYDFSTGQNRLADECSFVAQIYLGFGGSKASMHPAYMGTGIGNTAVAAVLPGTVLNQLARTEDINQGKVRIGMPEGVIEAEGAVVQFDSTWHVKKAKYPRTARRMMDGHVFAPLDQGPWTEQAGDNSY
jgi:2-methylaconitate cis-trans-isomerase PrpF